MKLAQALGILQVTHGKSRRLSHEEDSAAASRSGYYSQTDYYMYDSYYYDDYGYYGDYAYYDYDFDDFYVEDYYTSTATAIEPSGLLVDIKKTGLSDRDWFKIISYADNYFQGELYPLNAPAEFWDEIGFNGNL